MKVRDLQARLAELHPDATVYVYVGLSPGPAELEYICPGKEDPDHPKDTDFDYRPAGPSDMKIVLAG